VLFLIVGIIGASATISGVQLLKTLCAVDVPTHLFVSKSAAVTPKQEAGLTVNEVRNLAAVTYTNGDIGAAVSSGSFPARQLKRPHDGQRHEQRAACPCQPEHGRRLIGSGAMV
jgi:3-polyprenyl-4-hydroxybenzoate decarboxylase